MKISSQINDIEVINRILAGQTAEFRILVERYKDVSLSLACSVIKDQHLAEDALQEAFIKVFHSLNKFRQDSLFSTWLYRIVVNCSLNYAKKNKRFQPETNNPELVKKESDYKGGFEMLNLSERSKLVNDALAELKDSESLVLRLHYLSELSVQEIKEVTDYSESNIKVLLHRGRKNLLQILENELGEEINLFRNERTGT
ncbi:RNA polymerase sigma factor [Marinigracilibium pacificum]|uniref:RNA polymerase sigma factor n=1 Tax=Marinigracilibium pacificum TaxID=2729599 RepID=A0A848IW29_9BACT|nr:RNA polymerase sigma factor [Marinigracilibium pacificum]NMM47896.1 RNA polymerase sigma factor [Marinigracilibium pacificum]